MLYANNFIDVNRNAYGVENGDLAVILVARHFSTPYSFNDAMWEKYGETLAAQSNFPGAETDGAPATNPLGGSGQSTMRGVTLDTLFAKGLQLAVCQVATRAFAGGVARAVGADANDIYEEITDNLVENANLTPAGIVAVNRAQERGYTFAYVG
jgi:intracellular sulfur oxidation DsrE/DsrF family protein